MRPADRLLELLNLLRARRSATAAELADELGVSVRTLYRDVDALRGSGIPIDGEAGVGYRLRAGHELPPLTFDTDELVALVTGARMVFRFADAALGEAARRALHKIEAAVPPALGETLRRSAVFVPQASGGQVHPVAPIGGGPPALEGLRRAIDERRRVALEYQSKEGFTERTVRPVGLFFWGARWSLAAWCELRGDWRNFREDRIRGLTVLDERFEGDGLDAFLRAMRDR